MYARKSKKYLYALLKALIKYNIIYYVITFPLIEIALKIFTCLIQILVVNAHFLFGEE
jgi:hypothetical protein